MLDALPPEKTCDRTPDEPHTEGKNLLAVRSVVVLRALRLGDMLCAVPALRALRAALPRAHVTLVGLPWARDFARRFDRYLDDFVSLPGFPGLPEQSWAPDELADFIAHFEGRRSDLAIQLHGDGSVSNRLIIRLGARRVAGFFLPEQPCPDNETFFPYPRTGTERVRLLSLMAFLGAPACRTHLEFPLGRADLEEIERLDPDRRLRPGMYACVHPGGRAMARRWAPEGFARVGDWLAHRGLTVVLTGIREESDLTARLAALMTATPIDVCGHTSLGALAALLSRARMLVSNDTGVAHLAEAVGLPSVVLFASSEVERWAPLDRAQHRVLSPVERVTPEMVMTEVNVLIASPPSSPTEPIDASAGQRGMAP